MIQLTIPVYYTKVYKRKKNQTILVSLNWFRNAFYHEQNKVKQYFSELIQEQLKNALPLNGPYQVTYKYYYKNSASDLPNVTAMCSKWINDSLQDLHLISNDNVQYLVKEIHEVIEQDKDNPRCIVEISTIEEIK